VSRAIREQELLVPAPPEAVLRRLVQATATLPGYVLDSPAPGTLVLTRSYRPTWATALAVVGALFVIGLLALLVRETETIVASVEPTVEGTVVTLVGVGSAEAVERLDEALRAQNFARRS
jgi:hypothetical protein